jgi:hypothetical protein
MCVVARPLGRVLDHATTRSWNQSARQTGLTFGADEQQFLIQGVGYSEPLLNAGLADHLEVDLAPSDTQGRPGEAGHLCTPATRPQQYPGDRLCNPNPCPFCLEEVVEK